MTEQGAVPMIVMTRSQDHVEAINSTLRKAGHPVHCTWLPDARDLVGRHHAAQSGDAGRVHRRARHRSVLDHEDQAADRPRNAGADRARDQVDEAAIAEAMRLGAQDVVTLANRSRLQSVATRELRALPARAGAVDHALLGARVPRAAAEIPRGLGGRHHPRAGGHHRRCQPRVARAVRLLRRRCAHRHAADGPVRAWKPTPP